MTGLDALFDEVDVLPPGPWKAFGSAVYSGTNIVAYCAGPDGPKMAAALAKMPDLVHLLSMAYPSLMAARIADLEEALSAMTHRCECQ